jgi:hypothetical protein
MTTQQPGSGNNQSQQAGNAQHGDAAASVGGATSGEAGATPQHETLAETGGSGGAGLTGNQAGKAEGRPAQAGAAPSRQGEDDPVVADSGARGAQDTRSRQAGGSTTGLGVPESGANQTPADMEHKP